ncbi:FkbM family methyltransferase [Lyngbya confervoides]|uniref:FkbM family methyltransferase n=1 Tax=Lyngbya confervoides BDU141951 TaxID=1574623 RepID=A0ABD4T394_9CYAN|nr:FkbM family methyltransferase [Lyngbya confervoides]MCM1983139.1 FkbM family methyltransferase [Lyngbya confervoides BDU141951]
MMNSSSHGEAYRQYLKQLFPDLRLAGSTIDTILLPQTQWDEPKSGADWNNVGVMALLEAEATEDSTLRSVYWEMAAEALQTGADNFPLAAVHLALLQGLLGEDQAAINAAFQILTQLLSIPESSDLQPGLVYIPLAWSRWPEHSSQIFQGLVLENNGYAQVMGLAAEVLWRSHLVFYNPSGLRLLQIAAQILPDSAAVQLRLGISMLANQRLEGLVNLRKAWELAPDLSVIAQAFYLACRDQGQVALAQQWREIGKQHSNQYPQDLSGAWATISDRGVGRDLENEGNRLIVSHSPAEAENYTTVVFDQDILMAVEPSFKSIVTSVLIAEGDWFEKEMEWWRSFVKPGMTVIDVGANVGVYTFSAAKRVGPEGRVIAVEPFPGCVDCLKKTRQLNGMDWVSVVEGAASNQNGTALLGVSAASELNELIEEDETDGSQPRNALRVQCLTLDEICDRENLSTVDLLKIDAEGHELSVLQGSRSLIAQFTPVILYENIAAGQQVNPDVTPYLVQLGYQILWYQPGTETLEVVDSLSTEETQALNLIAVHESTLKNINARFGQI